MSVLKRKIASLLVLVAAVFALCYLLIPGDNSEETTPQNLEQQYQWEQQQRVERNMREDLNQMREEMIRLQNLNSELMDNMQTLTLLVLDLDAAQTQRLDSLEDSVEAVHECAQLIPFVERVRELCNGEHSHYCRVVRQYERRCHTSDQNNEWELPGKQGAMQRIVNSADRHQSR